MAVLQAVEPNMLAANEESWLTAASTIEVVPVKLVVPDVELETLDMELSSIVACVAIADGSVLEALTGKLDMIVFIFALLTVADKLHDFSSVTRPLA